MDCSMPGFPVLQYLLEFTQVYVHWVSDAILSCPLLLLPSIFPSIRVFSNTSALCIRCPKYWSFCFSIRPSNEYSGLISFRMDWLDLLAVQGTLKSLLQHHSSKASVLRHLAFFMVQLSHPYTTIGKTIALTIWIFVSKVMFLLFDMLCRFFIAFLCLCNITCFTSPDLKQFHFLLCFPIWSVEPWGWDFFCLDHGHIHSSHNTTCLSVTACWVSE